MRHALAVTGTAIAGGLLTSILLVTAVLILVSGTPDRDGGRSMAIVFGLGPFLAAVTAVGWGLWMHRRLRRSAAAAVPDQPGAGWRATLAWSAGLAGTLLLGIAAMHLITAGGGENGLLALAVAVTLGGVSWGAGRRR